jgi:MFS transporter, ACDE family, multidrug resistance protein
LPENRISFRQSGKDTPIPEKLNPDGTKKPHSFMKDSLPWFMMAHFGHHLLTALPGPLLPSIRDTLGLSNFQATWVTTAYALASGAGNVPAGRLADKIGPTILMTVAIVGVAVGGLLTGLSNSYLMFMIFLILMGFMTAGYHPASSPMILSAVEPEKRGRAMGWHLAGGNLSFFVAPLLAGAIMWLWPSMGFHGPFIVLSIPTAVIGIIFFIYLTKRGGATQVHIAKQKQAEEKPPQPGYKRRLVAYLIQMIVGGGAGMSVNALLGLYMVDKLGASDASVTWVMSIMFLPAVFGGTLLGGWISDRIGTVRIIIATGIIGGLLIFGIRSSTSLGIGFYLLLFIMGINQAIRMPVTEVFIMGQTPAKNRATIYGIYYFTMQYTGAIFAPIYGWLVPNHYSYEQVFMFSAIAVTAVSILTSFFFMDAKEPNKA